MTVRWQKLKNFLNRRGQNTVEFLLMMAAVVTLVTAIFATFNRDIVGIFFYFIGSVID